ncbi:MAG: ThiF family adenylyltransferase, partial [Thermoplasmata archaeon]
MENYFKERYSRQIILEKFGENRQKLLKSKSAIVIGLGGTGGLISQLLVRAGLGTLYINDFDNVSISNIHRQLL